MLASWKKTYGKPRQSIKKQRHYFADKGPYSQSCGFSSSHVQIWELDNKEGWGLKNWCFWTVVLENSLESPLDSKETKLVNPRRNQPWISTREDWCWNWSSNTLATWCEEMTHWKKPWCWERLRVGGEKDNREWDVWMAISDSNRHELEQTQGDSERQGSLECCSSWDHKEPDLTQ